MPTPSDRPTDGPTDRDNPNTHSTIVYALYGICALLVVIDLWVPKHGPFAIEYWFGFYAFYGFVVSVGLVVVAKWLRAIVMRPEDYYDE